MLLSIYMAESEVNKRIREAYEATSGSKVEVLAEVNKGKDKKDKKDKTKVNIAQVRQWFLENKHTLKKKKAFNSYVAPEPLHEIQIDMLHYKYKQPPREGVATQEMRAEPFFRRDRATNRANAEDRPPYAVIAIDSFTKKMDVQPMTLNEGKDWKEALNKIVAKLGKPKVMYSDPDSSLGGREMKGWFTANNIQNVISKQHASIAERGIRYLKNRLDDKLAPDRYSDEGPESFWKKHYKPIVNHYNQKNKQDTTNMTPDDAVKPENEYDVKTNLEIKAKHDLKYPVLDIGDTVRAYKKRPKFAKERVGDYEDGTRKVMGISTSMGQKFYKLDNDDHQYIRADIALIKKGVRPPLPPPAGDDGDDPKVPKDVNALRNIKLDDDTRVVEPPKVKKEPNPPDWDAYKRLNKKDREKALERMRKAKDKVEGKEPEKVADQRETGGASGSGIPRDAAGRAI